MFIKLVSKSEGIKFKTDARTTTDAKIVVETLLEELEKDEKIIITK